MTNMLECTGLKMVYPGQTTYALGPGSEGVSFEVPQGELFALLGPSGCGKTTTLRIVGGFVDATAGQITIDGSDVTRHPSYNRPTNTVFQNYALFPHLRLGSNIEYGLKMEGVAKEERRLRVGEALELVGLGGMQDRRISELSGGQQQRAALARAIIKRPKVLLLDEPLGALDLRLRRQMQDELVHLKRETGTTFIHVTHDQEEACAIADRIAVMDQGLIVQVDTPEALYRSPRTSYVAEFIDAGTVVSGASRVSANVVQLEHAAVTIRGPRPPHLAPDRPIAVVLPHNRVSLAAGDATPRPQGARGVVDHVKFSGSIFQVSVTVDESLEVRVDVSMEEMARAFGQTITPGTSVTVSWSADDVIFVEDNTGLPVDLTDDVPATERAALRGTSKPATINEGSTRPSAIVHRTRCTMPTDQNNEPHDKDRSTVQEMQGGSRRPVRGLPAADNEQVATPSTEPEEVSQSCGPAR